MRHEKEQGTACGYQKEKKMRGHRRWKGVFAVTRSKEGDKSRWLKKKCRHPPYIGGRAEGKREEIYGSLSKGEKMDSCFL